MNLSKKLQIILVTYNRAPQLRHTLSQLFANDSPVRDLNLTILDNHSSDETPILIEEYAKSHPNITHIVHRHNVGGNANIAKALELATYDYAWIICDDDEYHWEGWAELESAIADGAPLICAATFNIKQEYRDCEEYIFHQMTFLPGIVFSRQVLDDIAIRNAYDCVFHLFPHLAPVIGYLNANGRIRVLEHGLVTPGTATTTDTSYTRGHPLNKVFTRARTMTFAVGYSNAVANLMGRNHARFFATMISGDFPAPNHNGWSPFFREVFLHLDGRENAMHFCDLLRVAPFHIRIILRTIRLCQFFGLAKLFFGSKIYWILRSRLDRKNAEHSAAQQHHV